MNGWRKAELSEEKESVIPVLGQSVVLYLCPHGWKNDWKKAWRSDIGSLDHEAEDGLVWCSAFGIHSTFDGVKFGDILKDYAVCFAEVPPLEAGRFPSPLGIPVNGASVTV